MIHNLFDHHSKYNHLNNYCMLNDYNFHLLILEHFNNFYLHIHSIHNI